MSRAAHVNSIEALEQFKAGLCQFGDEAGQALAAIRTQIQRFVHWLEHDQLSYWKREIRIREDRVAEAKSDLHRCLAATIDPHRSPSCYQEKKLLEIAKCALDEAEHKLAAVRRWIPIVEQAVMDYQAKSESLATLLSAELPRATGRLDRLMLRLTEYQDVALPSATLDQSRDRVTQTASTNSPPAQAAGPVSDEPASEAKPT